MTCPFCKDTRPPDIESDRVGKMTTSDPSDFIYYAQCQRCLARGPVYSFAADALASWEQCTYINDDEAHDTPNAAH